VTHEAVAASLSTEHTPLDEALAKHATE
jgi:hypothetical protein